MTLFDRQQQSFFLEMRPQLKIPRPSIFATYFSNRGNSDFIPTFLSQTVFFNF